MSILSIIIIILVLVHQLAQAQQVGVFFFDFIACTVVVQVVAVYYEEEETIDRLEEINTPCSCSLIVFRFVFLSCLVLCCVVYQFMQCVYLDSLILHFIIV